MKDLPMATQLDRRRFLHSAAQGWTTGLALGAWGASRLSVVKAAEPELPANALKNKDGNATAKPALVAITLDLEMSRHYPTWDQTHWDYEKGNLDEATKHYAVEAGRRIEQHGGRAHYFAVGQVFEQADMAWLESLVAAGHPVGNHTYDHVNLLATRPEDLQFRFQRAPWLIEGRTPHQVIDDNVRLCSRAMRARLGIDPNGFRTPGGFQRGLYDRPDVQRLLVEQGFSWISSLYPAHPVVEPNVRPNEEMFAGLLAAQPQAQPFTYPGGLLEVPMSPISDVGSLRTGRWKLDAFLEATRQGVEWAIDQGAVFDFLAHPSCLVVADPEFRVIELICRLVAAAGNRAKLANLGELAERGRGSGAPEFLTAVGA